MSHPLFDLSGRVALVSGAASGMGRADLMLADLNGAGMEETAGHIERLGRRAVPTVCDISDASQINAMFERLDGEFGRIDVLGNVAGEGVLRPPLELTASELTSCLQNLVVGRLVCCQQAGKRMLAAGRGSIINIVSIAGLTAMGRNHLAYSIAMGGVAQMTRELSTEWSSKGVRVNAVVCAQITNQGLQQRLGVDGVQVGADVVESLRGDIGLAAVEIVSRAPDRLEPRRTHRVENSTVRTADAFRRGISPA